MSFATNSTTSSNSNKPHIIILGIYDIWIVYYYARNIAKNTKNDTISFWCCNKSLQLQNYGRLRPEGRMLWDPLHEYYFYARLTIYNLMVLFSVQE